MDKAENTETTNSKVPTNKVQEHYAQFAQEKLCGTPVAPMRFEGKVDVAGLGYNQEELDALPKTANLGLSCGNPLRYAKLRPGDTVLDLGCGAGLDSFIAARKVGQAGTVIGIDVTPEMIELAQRNAQEGGFNNVSFLMGSIENIPLETASIDVILSNCAMHLTQDTSLAFAQVFRLLRPKGHLCMSDIVLTKDSRSTLNNFTKSYEDCLSHAIDEDVYLDIIRQAGFRNIEIVERETWPFFRGYASICLFAYKE